MPIAEWGEGDPNWRERSGTLGASLSIGKRGGRALSQPDVNTPHHFIMRTQRNFFRFFLPVPPKSLGTRAPWVEERGVKNGTKKVWMDRWMDKLSWRQGCSECVLADEVSLCRLVQSDGWAAHAARAGEDAATAAAQRGKGQPGPGAPAGGGQPGEAGQGRPATAPAALPGMEEARCPGRGSPLIHVRTHLHMLTHRSPVDNHFVFWPLMFVGFQKHSGLRHFYLKLDSYWY